MNIYKIYSLIKDTYKTFRLIKDKNSSFSEIEKGIDLISSSPETVARILSDRIDLPQYVLEWLAVTVNDMKNLISVFADHPNEANNIDITLLTERQIDLVAIQTTNIRIMKQLLRYRKRLSFYGLMENPNIPSKMVSQLIKCSGWCADHFVNTKYPFNAQQIDIIAKKYPDLLTKWLVLIDANQTLIERYLPYVDSEDIYVYTIVDKLPQYFHEYSITQDNDLTVNITTVAPNISFIIKHLDKICRDK